MNNKTNEAQRTQEPNAARLFTPKQRLAMPGEDPNRCEQLYAELCRHFEPADPIEAMWVNDVAVVTAKIEFLRKCHRAATLVSLRRAVRSNAHFTKDISSEETEPTVVQILTDTYDLKKKPGVYDSEENLPIVRLLGATSLNSLSKEEDFMGLEFAALRERDRIIAQIGRKRQEEMRAAVTIIDAQCGDDNAQE
jgi:hypothetical protein